MVTIRSAGPAPQREGSVTTNRLAGCVLDGLGAGFLAVVPRRTAVLANAAARVILNRRDGIAQRAGTLIFDDATGAEVFEEAVAAVCNGGLADGASVRMIELRRPSGDAPYQVAVSAMCLPGPFRSRDSAALVVLYDPDDHRRSVGEAAKAHYRFTRAEAHVVELLLVGTPLPRIAKAFGVSVGTVRTHVKRLFAKTGTSTQAELVGRLLSTPGAWVGVPA